MYKVLLVRNGQSTINGNSVFDSSERSVLNIYGRREAIQAGESLRLIEGYKADLIYCGFNLRSRETASLIAEKLQHSDLKVIKNWRLTSPKYGDKVSLKDLAVEGYKKSILEDMHVRLQTAQFLLAPEDESYGLQSIESSYLMKKFTRICCNYHLVKETYKRTIPYWESVIVPQIKNRKNVIVVTSQDNIRAIAKHVDNLKFEESLKCKIPRGIPLCYQMDENMRGLKFEYSDYHRYYVNCYKMSTGL